MRFTTLLALLPLFSALVAAEPHRNGNHPPYRRHLARMPQRPRPARRDARLMPRQGGPVANDTTAGGASAEQSSSALLSATADTTAGDAATTSATGSGQFGDTIAPLTSSTASSTSTSSASTTSLASSSAESSASPIAEDSSAAPAPASSAPAPSSADTNVAAAPITLSSSSSSQTPASTSTRTTSRVSITTATRTASASSTAAAGNAGNAGSEEKSGGLSKTALIVIIVLASVVGLGTVLVFAIRKWKLKPSNRFDARMKPIDFSPHTDGMNDDFLEKTLHRTASNDMADRQRQQFVKELEADPNYVAGIPEHDFTAGTAVNNAGYGAAYNDGMYNHDPFAHAQAYEYDDGTTYYAPQHGAHAYPPAGAGGHDEYAATDYPTQDTEQGYTNLQRGNSNGSDHAPHTVQQQQVYPNEFPTADQYLGRPTGGADGPYAQAAQYRAY